MLFAIVVSSLAARKANPFVLRVQKDARVGLRRHHRDVCIEQGKTRKILFVAAIIVAEHFQYLP
jgi:hypothetical protein